MSEVEKLYRNCGIENYRLVNYSGLVPNGYIIIDDENREGYVKEIVRDFTAEKQIKIIEWLGNSKAFFDANETIFSLITNHKDKNGVVKGYEGKGNSVDSCLASLVNNLWQDLTDAERKQIKEILSE